MAKETTAEKYIKKAVASVSKKLTGTNIEGCNFTGVKFDETATTAMIFIAEALETNAEACKANAEVLKELAKALNVSGVHIEAMVKIGG